MVETTFHLLLYRAFHAQRGFLRPCLERIGLGPGQPKVVDYLREHGPCRQRALGEGELRKDTQQRHCRREHHKAQDALSLQALIEHGGLPSLFLAESAPKGTKAARFCSSISARKKACKKKGRQGGRLTPAGLAGLCGGVV